MFLDIHLSGQEIKREEISVFYLNVPAFIESLLSRLD